MPVLDCDLLLRSLPVAFLCGIPRLALYAYAMARMLDVRRPRLYFATCAVAAVVAVPLLPTIPLFARFLLMMAFCLFPAFVARDRVAHRVFVVVVAIVMLVASDSAVALAWLGITGDDLVMSSARGHLPAYAAISAIHLVVLGILYTGLRHYVNRFLNPDVRRYVGEGPRYFVLFPLMQLPLLCIAAVGLLQVPPEWSAQATALMFSMSVLSLAADLLLFYAVDQFVLERYDAARVEVLTMRLDSDLRRYRQLALVLENSAQLRHDLRNQVQVIHALADRGEFDRARTCVAELLGEIEQIDEMEREAAAAEADDAPASPSTESGRPAGGERAGGDAPSREEGARRRGSSKGDRL